MLYTDLIWKSTLLLALCTDDIIPPGSEFGKYRLDKLKASDLKNNIEVSCDENVSNLPVTENIIPGTPETSSIMGKDESSTDALR